MFATVCDDVQNLNNTEFEIFSDTKYVDTESNNFFDTESDIF